MERAFDYIDLFAGIGGFHAVLNALGGRGVLAAEIDGAAAAVYEANWGLSPERDVVELAQSPKRRVPEHTVLAGGFPCQPFSKSGAQLGMGEQRGQLFHELLKILRVHKPPLVALENVRNIAGPRQGGTWAAVITGLREVGYRVSAEPLVFSPHLLPPHLGGAPQVRDRVYILGTYVGRHAALASNPPPAVRRAPVDGWDPMKWDLSRDVLLDDAVIEGRQEYVLSRDERLWLDTWNKLLKNLPQGSLPGHPLWSAYWEPSARVDPTGPEWKQRFEQQNLDFYARHEAQIQLWLGQNPQLRTFPSSRQKLEWQAQDARYDLYQCLIHFRPSGIRVKQPTYAPALVAMAQTPVFGPRARRLVPREAARLQGFPDWFDFGTQRDGLTYKQLGNAINIGAAYYVLRKHVLQDANLLEASKSAGAGTDGALLVDAVRNSPEVPVLAPPTSE